MDIIYSKSEDFVIEYQNFLSSKKNSVSYYESFSIEESIKYNQKYQMENYEGHITLKFDHLDSQYSLYYQDILIGSLDWGIDVANKILSILINSNIEIFAFEHKIKMQEIVDFCQYTYWDIAETNRWYINQFKLQFQIPSDKFTMETYTGKFSVLKSSDRMFLQYDNEIIYRNVIKKDFLIFNVIAIPKKIEFVNEINDNEYEKCLEDFYVFRKHIFGSSDLQLESWINKYNK